jgi:hypothetical protein
MISMGNRDPLGELGFEALRWKLPSQLTDGQNLYEFIGNNPLENGDYLGLEKIASKLIACLPLHPQLAVTLGEFRPLDVSPGDLVFKGLVPRSELFTSHLQVAKIAKIDSQGRVVDFHSLRHTFCTNLHRAGVSQREAMELMRHNDPRLTATTYTDTSLLSLQSAIQKLDFTALQIASQKLVAGSQSLSSPVNDSAKVSNSKTIENKWGKSLSGAAWHVLSKIEKWCSLIKHLRTHFSRKSVSDEGS